MPWQEGSVGIPHGIVTDWKLRARSPDPAESERNAASIGNPEYRAPVTPSTSLTPPVPVGRGSRLCGFDSALRIGREGRRTARSPGGRRGHRTRHVQSLCLKMGLIGIRRNHEWGEPDLDSFVPHRGH